MTHNSEPAGSGIASAEYHSHLITRESFIVSHRSLLTIWLIYSLNLIELLGGAIVLERHLLWFIVYESLNRLFISLPVLWVHFNKNIIYVTQLGVHSKLEIVFQCLSSVLIYLGARIPTVKLKIPGKSWEIRIPNSCYIQVIVLDLSYLPVAAVGT